MAKGKREQRDTVTEGHFNTVMWNYFEQLFYMQAEVLALQQLLIQKGNVTEAELSAARDQVKMKVKTHLDTLRQASPEKRLAFLRGVQGPLQ